MLDYVQRLCTDFVELHGDRSFADDAALVGGLARFDGEPVMVLGQQKGRSTKENMLRTSGMPSPEGYGTALARMRPAERSDGPWIASTEPPAASPAIDPADPGTAGPLAACLAGRAT